MAHIVFGTLTFSSLSFISVRDAVSVAAMYMVSAMFCQAVLMYELSGMRETISVQLATVIQDDDVSLGSMKKWALASKALVKHEPEFHPIPENEI